MFWMEEGVVDTISYLHMSLGVCVCFAESAPALHSKLSSLKTKWNHT